MRAVEPLVLACCLAAGRVAEAQGIRAHFGLGGGLTLPTGDYRSDPVGDGFNTGWQGMAFVDIARPRSPIGIRLEGSYGENNSNQLIPNQRTRLLGVTTDVIYEVGVPTSLKPYVLAGAGLYNVRLFYTDGPADTSGTKLSWNAGGGVRYGVRGASLFLEARYYSVERLLNATMRSYSATFYRPYGVRVTQVGLTAGVRFGTSE